MYPPDEVLAAARAIRPRLPRLLVSDAEPVAAELDRLLAEAAAGNAVDRRVVDVLASHETTRAWTRFFLNGEERAVIGTTRGFDPMPGQSPSPVPARLYACQEPGCATVWRCRAAGQPIPRCPAHGRVVEPLAQPA